VIKINVCIKHKCACNWVLKKCLIFKNAWNEKFKILKVFFENRQQERQARYATRYCRNFDLISM
jgi:hypothetical protein